ncbi:hypothetical protein [Intestinibacter bartlettii]|uniref:Uncharacterized protein n=1 Tax=Intestinibacter bartlettii TaxID=261299 RepID=A0ABS6DX97_9FIRM|nr:hypothetical protein [Intestinibacter bartlettii]MBU5336478.1 hypothetical protein [Intestinibacter bartlettii]MDO5010769.1 hypothetical protein [Intestinibacter bartlettii]
MGTLDERINNRRKKKKKLIIVKILSVIFMINIATGCIFFTDYNMNKMLNKKSIIDTNIEFVEKNIHSIEKIINNFNLNIKI